jgi:hypothetical protein
VSLIQIAPLNRVCSQITSNSLLDGGEEILGAEFGE